MASRRLSLVCISRAKRTIYGWPWVWINFTNDHGTPDKLRGVVDAGNKLGAGV